MQALRVRASVSCQKRGSRSVMRKADIQRFLEFPLSDEQLAAATAEAMPGVIVAGAGSGKTTVMAARVVWLVVSGHVDPDRILGLTFTRKATGQLQRKVRSALTNAVGNDVVISETADPTIMTYNAFAGSVLTDNAIRIGLEPDATLLTEAARRQRAYRVACRATEIPPGVTKPGPAAEAMVKLDESLANLAISPDRLIAFDEQLLIDLEQRGGTQKIVEYMREASQKRIGYARLVKRFRESKLENNEYDFADQVRLAQELAERFPDIGASIRERFGVVLLDEYQDSSIAQRRLMQALFGHGHAVTAVGDPLQAIYEWRGAAVSNIRQFDEHFPAANGSSALAFTLTSNRRSAPTIINFANTVSARLRDEYRVDGLVCRSEGRGNGDVTIQLFETSHAEATAIADDIVARDDYSSTVVLARNAKSLLQIQDALIERGVPCQLVGKAALLHEPEALDLRAMLEAIHDPVANAAVLRILTGPRYRIGHRDLAQLGRRAKVLAGGRGAPGESENLDEALADAVAGIDEADVVSLSDAAADLGDHNDYPLSFEARQRLTQFADELRELRRHVGEPLPDLVRRIVTHIGLSVEVNATRHRRDTNRQEILDAFIDYANEFVDLDGYSTLGAFLRHLDDAERFDAAIDVEPPARSGAVMLMTMHKAKGLEFAHVYLAAVNARIFPSKRTDGRWPTSSTAIPWSLREDAPADLCGFPDFSSPLAKKEHDAFTEASREYEALEELRLFHVAITRAERSLTITGSRIDDVSGTEYEISDYLLASKDACEAGFGRVAGWADAPTDYEHSVLRRRIPDAEAIANLAQEVLDSTGELFRPELIADERVTRWDRDIDLLIAEAQREATDDIVVMLPEAMSASQVIDLQRDPDAFARNLARPMPRRPNRAARRGTILHKRIEDFYQSHPMLFPDDLPGAADADIDSDSALDELTRIFEATPYAARVPAAIEAPFALFVAGRVIRGRIDAVFTDDDGFEVIDWKTGGRSSAHDLQLAIYRIAWSEITGTPLDLISAGFVMLRTGEVIRPKDLPDRAGVERILRGE